MLQSFSQAIAKLRGNAFTILIGGGKISSVYMGLRVSIWVNSISIHQPYMCVCVCVLVGDLFPIIFTFTLVTTLGTLNIPLKCILVKTLFLID